MSQAIEDTLLDATEAAIAEHGIAKISLERIAESAGVSRATIYRRGVTVGELLAAAVARAKESLRAALWQSLTGLEPAAVRLRGAAAAILDATEQHLSVLTSLYDAPRGDAPIADPTRNDPMTGAPMTGDEHEALFHTRGPDGLILDTFAAPFERLLADGALDGSLRPLPPEVTATVLLSTTVWGYVHLRRSHRWPLERARDAVIDLALHGVLNVKEPE